ncbi:TPA: hypothetical protein ACJH2W_004669, partial [Salmonella enterica subsp. enterica serovar Bovismorbificans]
ALNPASRRDRMCKCNTVTRDDIPFAIWSGQRPDTRHTWTISLIRDKNALHVTDALLQGFGVWSMHQ